MLDFLPRDAFIDVLTRLPIKTLVRFGCVCKSWYSLLRNPSFIATHLNRSSLVNNHHLLLFQSRSGADGNVVHYSLLRWENKMFRYYAELELPLKSHRNPSLRIIGSFNGLVCLSDDMNGYTEELYLWNPSIRKTMALPPLRVTLLSHGPFMHSVVGFGFNSLTDDYKVVRIVHLQGPTGFQTPPEVDIFSLSSGTWRNISHLGLPYTIHEMAPQAYLNGAAHWLAYHQKMRSNLVYLIVSFHMGDEVFGEIMLPSSIFGDISEGNVCVAKFQESLSLIVGFPDEVTCCIWVMEEYGISESWSKKFNIDMSEGLSKSLKSVVGFTKKGEVLFVTIDGCLVAYDPQAERRIAWHWVDYGPQTKLHIHGSKDSWYRDSFYANAYTESLILFNTVTCEESPLLHGEASSAKKKRRKE